MIELLQHLINGLSLGSIYALIALGYTLVFGILRLINFAHGDVYMIGAFTGLYATRGLGLGSSSAGTSATSGSIGALVAVLLISMSVCAILGFLIERLAYRPLRNAPRINALITAIGVSMLLEFAGQLIFGSDPKFFPQLYRPEGNWDIGGLSLNPLQLVVLGISVALMLALRLLVFCTRLGRAMRAVSFSRENAALMGIPADRVVAGTFMLGSALAGAAGVLVGQIYPRVEPLMGMMPGLKAFVAAVLGGIGNVTGAVVGALLLGLAEELVTGYGAASYRDALAFALLILILLIRPTGLFGSKMAEKV
jgi:branched-chain amino acid transport system permease protein